MNSIVFLSVIKVVDNSGQDDLFFLTININDLNDHTPVCKHTNYAATIAENSPAKTHITTLTVTDNDQGTHGTLTYSMVAGSYYFEVSNTGVLTLIHPPDREQDATLSATVKAQDSGGKKDQCYITVTLTDVNDVRPEFNQSFYDSEVRNDAATGTSITQTVATDGDVSK